MKKWTFSYHILLVAFVSLLASCSEQSDVSVEGPKEDAVKLSLIQSLDSINESISPTSTVRKFATALYSTNYWGNELKEN